MKKAYEAPEFEIEKFRLTDTKVFTITPSHEGGIEDGDTEDEW
jgi:hypothetical protein